MSRKKRFLIAGVVILAGGAAAVAAVGHRGHERGAGRGHHGMDRGGGMGPMMFGGMRGGPGMLKQLDADKDGAVTFGEFVALRKTEFDRLDANKDSAIDTKEFEASVKESSDYWAKRFVHRLDKDKDGRVSLEEFRSAPRERFAMRDLNGDGQITAEDMPPGRRGRGSTANAPDATKPDASAPDTAKKDEKGGRRWSLDRILGRADGMFKRFDTNSDGFIDAKELETSSAERNAFAVKRFLARFDADKDGRVTRDEFERFAKARFADLDLNSDGRITEEDLPPRMRGRGILR